MGRSVLLALVRSEIAQEMLDKASAVLFADRAKILRELSRIVMAVESEPADNYYATAGIDPRNIGLKLYRGFESPLSARFSNGSRMLSVPGGRICWNAGLPTLEPLQGAQSRHVGRLHQHTAGAKKERRTHRGHQKTIRATKDQVLRGGVRPDRAQLSGHTGDWVPKSQCLMAYLELVGAGQE